VMGIFMTKDNLWDRMLGGRDNVFRIPFHVCFKNPVSGYVFMWNSTSVFMWCMFPSVFSCPVMKKNKWSLRGDDGKGRSPWRSRTGVFSFLF
jgi:hypothetical protein